MGNKVRVLQVIHGMHYGGAENVIRNIITKIDSDKFNVSICCVNFTGSIGEALKKKGYDIIALDKDIGIIKTLLTMREVINNKQPDIIHTHGIPAFLAIAPIYIFQKKFKWIHTYHFGNYPHINKKYLYAQKVLSRFATKLVAVSESQRRAVLRHLYVKKEKITTIFNGVSSNPYLDDHDIRSSYRNEFGYTDEDIVVSCIVVLTKQKGVKYFLDSVSHIISENQRVKILIVGGGPLEEELKEQAKNSHFSSSIKFTGWRKDINKIMVAIDVFVLPSLWEGLPMVMLEAMASRLPVVATDIADNANVLKNGKVGLIVPPKDSVALGDAIIKIVNDKEYAKSLGESAINRYRSDYEVEKMVSNYEKLYMDNINC